MRFYKSRNVLAPKRAHSKDAGIDFFIPEFTKEFKKDFKEKNSSSYINNYGKNEHISIPANGRVLIPSGLHVSLPHEYALIAFNKSGVATKKGLDILASVVDETYQGEIHLSLSNTTDTPVQLLPNEKVVQFILIHMNYLNPIEIETLEKLYPEKTKRGVGGFGSTGQ